MVLLNLEKPACTVDDAPVIAIVGATGAVGLELLGCLERRGFPLGRLRLLASARSAGTMLPFKGQNLMVDELTEAGFDGVDIALDRDAAFLVADLAETESRPRPAPPRPARAAA